MPFKPGQSGNPGGRSDGAKKFAAAAAAVVDRLVIQRWMKEVEDKDEEWLECSKLLAAYAYGKPASQPEESADGAYTVVAGKRLSFDELKEHNAIAAAAAKSAEEQH